MTDAEAQALLLRGERVTLTGLCLPLEMCQHMAGRYGQTNPLSADDLTTEVKRVIAGFEATLCRPLDDIERRVAYGLAGFLAPMPGGEARAYVEVLVSEKIWFPDRHSGPRAEKLATDLRVKILGMVAIHAKEARRRATVEAEERRLHVCRASKTPEQRAAFVAETLARARQGGVGI